MTVPEQYQTGRRTIGDGSNPSDDTLLEGFTGIEVQTRNDTDAWGDLISAPTVMRKGATSDYNRKRPLHCDHDCLMVCVDNSVFTQQELAQLAEWGFSTGSEYDDTGFSSFRFGSA